MLFIFAVNQKWGVCLSVLSAWALEEGGRFLKVVCVSGQETMRCYSSLGRGVRSICLQTSWFCWGSLTFQITFQLLINYNSFTFEFSTFAIFGIATRPI